MVTIKNRVKITGILIIFKNIDKGSKIRFLRGFHIKIIFSYKLIKSKIDMLKIIKFYLKTAKKCPFYVIVRKITKLASV